MSVYTRAALTVLVMMLGLLLAGSSSASGLTPASLTSPPEGVNAGDWASITAQIQARQYTARPGAEGGLVATNPAHGWHIAYQADGHTVLWPSAGSADADGGYQIALQLQAVGYGDASQAVGTAPALATEGETVSYQWRPSLREWWVNGAQGVEQWFELTEPPSGQSDNAPLTLSLALETGLQAAIQGNGLQLRSADGATRVRYASLKAWDADRRPLLASMTLSGPHLVLSIDDAGARYPITIDPTFTQQAYLKASNAEAGDHFGWSVAVSGDTVVIGTPFEGSNATGVNGNQADNSADAAGAAYVFLRAGGLWSQQAYLKASNSDSGDFFGLSVAASGDTVVVGALGEDSNATGINGDQADNSAESAGAAYVFVRSGNTWSQQAYLKASITDVNDQFGFSVAVSGDTVVVGAVGEDSSATGINGDQTDNAADFAGAAYVFVRTGGIWSQQAYMKASNSGAGDTFGTSVAVSVDTVVVGSDGENSNATGVNGNQADESASGAGAAYVFVRTGSSWSQQAYLKATNADAGDHFGTSVAVSGDTVVVGAPTEGSNATGVDGDGHDNSAQFSGAAYVFVRSGGVWSQQAYLKASNTSIADVLGFSVAVSGDTVVVGAQGEDSSATGINGNQADNSARGSGAAYVFVRSGASWSQLAYIKASNTDSLDILGGSVAVSGDTVVIGASAEGSSATGVNGNQADNSAADAGAAYVFQVLPGIVVDGNTNNFQPIANNDPSRNSIWPSIAQSFTAEDPHISFGFRMLRNDFGNDETIPVTYNLYRGDGMFTELLASRTAFVRPQIQPPFSNVGFVDADFSTVQLIPGQRYTVEATPLSGDLPLSGTSFPVGIWTSLENIYPGGRFYFPSGAFNNDFFANQDMSFRAVPSAGDGNADTAGGTVVDDTFGARAQVAFPPAVLTTDTVVTIDVFADALTIPLPKGFSAAGTKFVNIQLSPEPDFPLPAPGLTVTLPLNDPLAPGTLLMLFKIDQATGLLIPAISVLGGQVAGFVDAPGDRATFTGIASLSTVVGLALLPPPPPPPANHPPTGTLSIAGDPREGETVLAADTLVDTDGLGALSYRWFLDGATVPGATTASLALDDLAVGKNVQVEVRYTDGRGFSERVRSAPVGPITPAGTALAFQKRVFFFNPASNVIQESVLRLINPNPATADVEIQGFDDNGVASGVVTVQLAAGEARQVRSLDLESGNAALGLSGSLGDGDGKWQFKVNSSAPIAVMSLVRVPGDQLASMSELAPTLAPRDYRVLRAHANPTGSETSVIRVVNRSSEPARVQIQARDNAGQLAMGNVELNLAGNAAVNFNTTDYALGNSGKGLLGEFGTGDGYWTLEVSADRNLAVQSLLRSADGILSNVSGIAPSDSNAVDSDRLLFTVNPVDSAQVSVLRIVNLRPVSDTVVLAGIDDNGQRPTGPLFIELPALGAVELDSRDLENGNPVAGIDGVFGAFGDGSGRWQVVVSGGDHHVEAQALSVNAQGTRTSLNNVAPAPSLLEAQVWLFNPASNVTQQSVLRIINRSDVDGQVLIEAIDDAGQPAPGGGMSLDIGANAAIELSAQDLEAGNTAKVLIGALGDGSGKWRLHVSADVRISVQSLLISPTGVLNDLSNVVE